MSVFSNTLHIVAPTVDFEHIVPTSKLLASGDTVSQPHHHSSLADADFLTLICAARQCHRIIFHPGGWDIDPDLDKMTKLLLSSISHWADIEGFVPKHSISIFHQSLDRDPAPRLWVFGCSHSYGTGLDCDNQRYANLLAEQLNLPLKLIAHPGSSLTWSLNCLVNSPIQVNDTVIWQITNPGRLLQFTHKEGIVHTGLVKYPVLLDFFNEDQIFFDHVNLVRNGVNFLRLVGAKFALTSILPQDSDWWYTYHREYVTYPEYCYAPDSCIDFGNDGIHAGPLSQQILADRLQTHLHYTYG